MIIIEDFIVNLAAGFTQTLLQHIAKRALGDPQQRALRQAYQSGFELMLRSAGSGLRDAAGTSQVHGQWQELVLLT